ncbi:MAG: recombinase family protein, partial [Alphaproteobacteria bacterium]
FDNEIGAERHLEGNNKAKERGVAFGRKKKLTPQERLALQEKRKNGTLIKDLMKEYGLSKASVYLYLR